MHTLTPRAARALRWTTIPVAFLASAGLVWQASYSAFSATTTNASNNWAAASVTLTDDDANSAMFNATGLQGGSTGSKCIEVTYGSAAPATVKLYGSATGTLGSYLDITVEEGTGGTFADCTGFTAGATIFTGTLAGFAAASNSFATGVGSFAPTASGQSKTFKITYRVQDNNAAQGTSASATFTWEAQS